MDQNALMEDLRRQLAEATDGLALFRALFDTSDSGYSIQEAIYNADGRLVDFLGVDFNRAYEKTTGIAPWRGRRLSEIHTVEDYWFDFYDNVLRTGSPGRIEEYSPQHSIWLSVNASRIGGQGSKLVASVFENITSRKNADIVVRGNETKFRAVFDTMIEACCIFEMIYDDLGRPVDWKILEANAGYEKQSGLKDVAGKLASEVMPGTEPYWIETFGRVVETGEAEQIEKWHQPTGRWIHSSTARVGGSGSRRLVSVFYDITERKRAEIALRESEERQAFLLELSDALRPLSEPIAIQETACRLLGRYLGVDRMRYVEMDRPRDNFVNARNDFAGERPSHIGVYDTATFLAQAAALADGHSLAISEVATDKALSEAERAGMLANSVAAALTVALLKDGVVVAAIAAMSDTPRSWSDLDHAIIDETADRTWAALERARAEAALRESEERFQQFAEASAGALWIRDAARLEMEYVSPAITTIYGRQRDYLLGDIQKWAALIVPEDRESALKHIERARQGESVVHEFRIHRLSDHTFRWVRNTDFPLRDSNGNIQRIGGIAEDVTEAKLAIEHQRVLVSELQHRVRNIMAMIRSMADRSAAGADSIEDYRGNLSGRLLALSRVQVLLTRQANQGESLKTVVENEVSAQAHHQGQYELSGPDIMLSPKAVEVLSLTFHELSTNALKYGALSVPGGMVSVQWRTFEKRGAPWLSLDWVETGALTRNPKIRRGFGSDLIEGKIPYELGGSGRITIEPSGAHCHLELPLKDRESILETDAPMPTVVFGGALDMTGAPDLTGQTVLVVEDDYYIAADTAAALRGAGATVLGPYPSEETALQALHDNTPTAAVIDLNLGIGGTKFVIAHLLRKRAIPFVFLTGYDANVIPSDFIDVTRLQKPAELRQLVGAVAAALVT
ncbi:PAS domain S-box protein [Ensifer adhaerens]|uniref:PAS domain S-box protein n=1 Tax=Ensifer adhaerens TaxID=106592 RepID=UPI001CC1B8ED|nr:PAS domain S-box protein [Ensifer adhaerens]MBZ7927592.1 PAS domain S-box protein [Ensifer adhaerens]